MFRIYGKKHGFTLVEVLTVCSMFAVMVIGIIFAINRTFVLIDNSKVDVVATNLAREGIEMIYNFRDSNRRKHSGERDKYWLYCSGTIFPSVSQSFDYLGPGYYAIKQEKTSNGDNYITFQLYSGSAQPENFYEMDGFFSVDDSVRKYFEIEFTGNYSYYSGGSLMTGNLSDLLGVNGSEFYRVARVYGVYRKNETNANVECIGDCLKDGTPAEMRFCVKVFYKNVWGKHAKELCSIMTNFME